MPWVRLDDQFPQHPKVVGVGPLGIAMQVAGLCYCSRFLTDGFLPTSAVPTLMDFSELDEHSFNGLGNICWKAVGKLVDSGMWEQTDGGYQIHDYLVYQPSKAKTLEEREANRIRQERFKGNAVTNKQVTPLLTPQSRVNNSAPVPVPVPQSRSQTQKTKTNAGNGNAPDGAEPPAPEELPFDEILEAEEYLRILKAIPGYILTRLDTQRLREWAGKSGLSLTVLAVAATSMLSKLSYSKGKHRWEQGTATYANIPATFENWARREGASSNGTSQHGNGQVSGYVAQRPKGFIDTSIRAGSKYGGVDMQGTPL